MKKMIFVFASFLAFVDAASAEIKGAFGIRFGKPLAGNIEILDGSHTMQITAESSLGDTWSFDFQRLQIAPPVSNSVFQHYEVVLTPASRLPFSISASGEFENSSQCHASERKVIELLMQKYPAATVEVGPYLPIKVIKSGAISVSAICSDHDASSKLNSVLSIIYRDDDAQTKAIDERLKTEDLNVTSDGL